ncbi:MAG: hypothetical protein ACR2OG_14200 [Gemmatimonadaceae bacterium]
MAPAAVPAPAQVEQISPRLVTLGRLELQDAGAIGDALNTRPRKLCVLAVLAMAQRPIARDALLEMFWGEQPEERARHSLSDALSHLRRVLGSGAILSRQADVALAPAARLTVDARDFESAVHDGEVDRALAMYDGEFLAGMSVEGSQSFDDWAERERARLRALFVRASELSFDAATRNGSWREATSVAARWAAGAPNDPKARRAAGRADAALAESASSRSAEIAPDGRSPFREGITAERAALEARWQRASAGRRQLVILSLGENAHEEGARLLAAIASRARSDEATVLAVRAYELERDVPLAMLASLVGQLADAPGIAAIDPGHLAELARVAPAIAQRFAPARSAGSEEAVRPERSSGGVGGERVRLLDAIRAAFESVAYEAPVLVRLDDLQWSDDQTSSALHYLLRALVDVPILFAATTTATGGDHATSLVDSLRRIAPDDTEILSLGAAAQAAAPAGEPLPVPTGRWPRRFAMLAASVTLLLMGAVAATALLRPSRAFPVIAVGFIRDNARGDSTGAAKALPELFATSLARVPELRVVSRARTYEALASLGITGAAGDSARALAAAARAAGATELVEGELYLRRGGAYRLDVRRVDMAGGVVRSALSVEGEDPIALVERATARLAQSLGATIPSDALRDVTSTSLSARHLYDDGLRAMYRGDYPTAHTLFTAALREDSTFAMAAHYLARTSGDPLNDVGGLNRALRLADHATDRERLLVRAHWAFEMNDPRSAAYAETLATRYPAEIEGPYLLAQAYWASGDFARAIALFRQVITADSVGVRGVAANCPGCDALAAINMVADAADSFPVVQWAARTVIRQRPPDAGPWWRLADMAARQGRFDSAAAFARSARALEGHSDGRFFQIQIAVRRGNLVAAESLITLGSRNAAGEVDRNALDGLSFVHRLRGRMRAAVREAEQVRSLTVAEGASGWSLGLSLAITELLGGDPRRAAALFDSLSRRPVMPGGFPSRNARNRAWMLTHEATALARLGDTARVARLADSIERTGAMSNYARDRRLHHYVRALLSLARRDTVGALDEFARARYSDVETYYAVVWARTLLGAGRAAEAVRIASTALRGPLDSQNLYESRTELQEVLAEALAAVGDSAGASEHFRIVADSWASGDPPYAARAVRARERAGG